jgi:hypothetical protein
VATDGDYNQALASFSRRKNVTSAFTIEEWLAVPAKERERLFFVAGVVDAEILQRFREGIEEVIGGSKGITTVEKEIAMWLGAKGYKPPVGKEESFEDLSSLERINFELGTNARLARGHAQWVRDQTSIRAFHARRFFRLMNRMEPRDWETRWADAKAKTANVPGVHPTEKVALLNHPIWAALSRFGHPWPPFDFGSGMNTKLVSRREAKALGLPLDPNNDPMQQPLYRSMNEGLEVGDS